MRPEAVEYALVEFERPLSASFSDLTSQIGRMRQRSEQIQGGASEPRRHDGHVRAVAVPN